MKTSRAVGRSPADPEGCTVLTDLRAATNAAAEPAPADPRESETRTRMLSFAALGSRADSYRERKSRASGAVVTQMPTCFEPVLARLRAESALHFNAQDVCLTPVSYEERPFSHLLRLAVRGTGSAGMHIFVKIFKTKRDLDASRMRARVVEDFETTLRVHQAMLRWTDLGAVRPIVCYPEHLATVTEQVDGEDLLAHLKRHAAGLPREQTLSRLSGTLNKAGRWVQAFQSTAAHSGQISLDDLREYVDVRLKRLVASPLARFDEGRRSRVLDHLARLGRTVDRGDLAEVIVHGDLAPGNVIVSGDRVVVLDFAMVQRGSVFQDLTRLFFQIDLLISKPQFRPSVIHTLQRALLRGFDADLTPQRPLFRLLLMLHTVNHLTTLSVQPEPFPSNLYNWVLRRRHRRWIERELRQMRYCGQQE